MSHKTRSHQSQTGVRRSLRQMTLPAAIAYVIVTLLTLFARAVVAAAALVADVAERLADAGDTIRAIARGPVAMSTTSRYGAEAGQ